MRGIFVVVELEAGASIVIAFNVVASETWKCNATARGVTAIAFARVMWLLADVRACRHWHGGASSRRLGAGFGSSGST
jgi:hypothetical protein